MGGCQFGGACWTVGCVEEQVDGRRHDRVGPAGSVEAGASTRVQNKKDRIVCLSECPRPVFSEFIFGNERLDRGCKFDGDGWICMFEGGNLHEKKVGNFESSAGNRQSEVVRASGAVAWTEKRAAGAVSSGGGREGGRWVVGDVGEWCGRERGRRWRIRGAAIS